MSTLIPTSCAFCAASIQRTPWEMSKRKRFFCSHDCHNKWRREHQRGPAHCQYSRIEVQCTQCGVSIERNQYRAKKTKNHFCSQECDNNWRREHPLTGKENPLYTTVIVACTQCGVDVKRQPWQANMYQTFCGRKCLGIWRAEHMTGVDAPNWRGGHQAYYGPNWHAQRRAARKRDAYTCQRCGMTERELGRELDVHHKKPFREFGYIRHTNDRYLDANRLVNLISLCVSCHKAVEWRDEINIVL